MRRDEPRARAENGLYQGRYFRATAFRHKVDGSGSRIAHITSYGAISNGMSDRGSESDALDAPPELDIASG